MWDTLVLRAHAQKLPFFLSCFDRFGEKSQKPLDNDNFQSRDFLTVFDPFLQNGQNRIGKKLDFV